MKAVLELVLVWLVMEMQVLQSLWLLVFGLMGWLFELGLVLVLAQVLMRVELVSAQLLELMIRLLLFE